MIIFTAEEGSHVQFTDKPIYNTLVMGDMVQQKTVVVGSQPETATSDANISEDTKETSDIEEWSSHALSQFLSRPHECNTLLPWLHRLMDNQIQPKLKLKPLRAAYEFGYFIGSIPYNTYCQEFGEMKQPVYSKWMGAINKYDNTDLQNILESLDH